MQQKGRARWILRAAIAFLLILVMALATAWFSRERIAGNLIDGYFNEAGLRASYDIVSIGTDTQVIENLVIGDPAAPDLTVERVTVGVAYGWGSPSIGRATLEKPRLYGTYRDGALSFGALDALLFAESDEPAGLPALDFQVVDGGALVETDYGDVGAYLAGSGQLDDGFSGTLALTAPEFAIEDCTSQALTAYGEISTEDGTPRFQGPIRFRDANCLGATMKSFDASSDLSFDMADGRLAAQLNLASGRIAYAGNSAEGLTGPVNVSVKEGSLTLDHDLVLTGFASQFGTFEYVQASGDLRSQRDFTRSDWTLQVEGEGASVARSVWVGISEAKAGAEGTLIAPLLAKIERNLRAATNGGTLSANVTWRAAEGAQGFVVPEARFQSGTGETVLAISRLAWGEGREGQSDQLSGNFLTAGAGLPRINGRMEQAEGGGIALRMSMADYSAGADRISLPSLSVFQDRSGVFRLSGALEAGGKLPGGSVTGLRLPLNGTISSSGTVQMGLACQRVRFSSLALYDLALEDQSVEICPTGGNAILRYEESLRIDAQTGALALDGQFAGSPAAFAAEATQLRYPGVFALDNVDVVIGEDDSQMRLSATSLFGETGERLGGIFEGGSARIEAISLNFDEAAGRWTYSDGTLRVSEAGLVVTERIEGRQRFEPLFTDDAVLTLADSSIAAAATLRHRAKGVEIAEVLVAHDLGTAKGAALIDVEQLTFGRGLELTDLTYLAEGVVAYTNGTVTGEGRIVWDGDEVESDGVFRSDGLDLAAAFGPVRGLKGEVRFSDLINMTTEPGQVLEIGSINPGIEVIDGRLRFALKHGDLLQVEDARWPFMGGTLIMRPVDLRYGTDEEQRYTFEMIALDAAKFVSRMELTNIGATGIFDGTVPIIFDLEGNGRIENGLLISRPPGGNISYIGELTYEDLGTMGNYAFQSLRSLDYSQMSVALEGDLAGEIITRFQFDGVRQGEGASSNFVTRRLSRLPIRFNVNVRSENFYELAVMVRRFWDPDSLPDPVDQGLLSVDGERFVIPPERLPPPPEPVQPLAPGAVRSDDTTVQPSESDPMP